MSILNLPDVGADVILDTVLLDRGKMATPEGVEPPTLRSEV